MTSNSTLKTQKNLREIVYHYYRHLCSQFARPIWCWNVVDENWHFLYKVTKSHKEFSPIIGRTGKDLSAWDVSTPAVQQSLKLIAKCHALSIFILFHWLHSNTMLALQIDDTNVYNWFKWAIQVAFSTADLSSLQGTWIGTLFCWWSCGNESDYRWLKGTDFY